MLSSSFERDKVSNYINNVNTVLYTIYGCLAYFQDTFVFIETKLHKVSRFYKDKQGFIIYIKTMDNFTIFAAYDGVGVFI